MNDSIFTYTNPAAPTPAATGILAGSRLAIQPNLCVRGWPTEACSRALAGFVAIEDAVVVERLHAAGTRIEGATRIAELALGLAGDTSALAVASSHCDAALVTDMLGEARVAAAAAGLVGFKPTPGIISRYGLIGLMPSLECLGVVARDPAMIASILQAISGADARDFSLGQAFPDFSQPAAPSAVKTVAVIPHSLDRLSASERTAFDAALAAVQESGVTIREVPVAPYPLFRTIHQVIGAAEASSSAGKYDSVRYGHRTARADNWNEMYLKSREESFGTLVKCLLFQGAYFQFRNYAAFEHACRIRRQLVAALDDVLHDADLILLPTRTQAAVTEQPTAVSQIYDRCALTLAANVAGLPAISLPGFVTAGADDLGLQMIARRLDDVTLLGYAARLVSAQRGS